MKRRLLTLAAGAGLLLIGVGGCVSVSLATSTGPRPAGETWSDADRQMVHVGETVALDVICLQNSKIVASGPGTYCVVMCGTRRLESSPDPDGHFTLTHKIDYLAPGEEMLVEARIMQQVDSRDFMRVGDGWAASESPYNSPDGMIGSDKIVLEVYAAVIDLNLPGRADSLQAATGVLRLYPGAADEVTIYVDRPTRRGFVLHGPAVDGSYRLEYQPRAAELRSFGRMPFEFRIEDRAGRVHTATGTVETP